jgi:acetyl-CoA/propionyl-CoA carboxylase biotin carboxyl carrier protein
MTRNGTIVHEEVTGLDLVREQLRIAAQLVPPPAETPEPPARESLTVEVDGRRVEVVVPELVLAAAQPAVARRALRRAPSRTATLTAPSGEALVSPMQGSVVTIAVAEAERVEEGEPVMVIEAMKMEQQVPAHRGGVVTDLAPTVGDTLSAGAFICRILD